MTTLADIAAEASRRDAAAMAAAQQRWDDATPPDEIDPPTTEIEARMSNPSEVADFFGDQDWTAQDRCLSQSEMAAHAGWVSGVSLPVLLTMLMSATEAQALAAAYELRGRMERWAEERIADEDSHV